ncbi:hypothetical protein [Pseudosporangium ferrugineum]|uniref:Uncharacterized protein n=1 Tax=Pseudosporangium ferrugineum TaxID=439699 RepID=A0A2T0S7N8_9ACTN|nr:hypothetical protein [Pseudosporangium ferrugineum]PRY29428.1 hypothetical protein CLV70_106146 [Pseudosporangium ferrugineum]
MSPSTCGAESILRRGGPVQVPLQPCCVVALLHADRLPEPVTSVSCPLRADLSTLTAAAAVTREGVR